MGAVIIGLGYDVLGSYDPVIPILMGVLAVGAFLIAALGPYTFPAVAGFDRLAASDELAASQVLSDAAEGGPRSRVRSNEPV